MNSNCVFSGFPYEVKVVEMKKGENYPFSTLTPLILFNHSPHTIYMRWGEKEIKKVKKEEMIFLFPGLRVSFEAEKDMEVFLFYLPGASTLYYRHIQTFYAPKKRSKQIISSLPINSHLKELVSNMILYMNENIMEKELLEIKSAELFILLKLSYKADKLSRFFDAALCPERHFMALVLSHEAEAKTVEQLAKKCNISLPTFNKIFVRIFETSPYQWMKKRKTDRIYEAIYESSYPLKKVADETGFSSLTQMIDFCKKHIGMTPGEIRKKRISHETMN